MSECLGPCVETRCRERQEYCCKTTPYGSVQVVQTSHKLLYPEVSAYAIADKDETVKERYALFTSRTLLCVLGTDLPLRSNHHRSPNSKTRHYPQIVESTHQPGPSLNWDRNEVSGGNLNGLSTWGAL